jgi:hypothetical protein
VTISTRCLRAAAASVLVSAVLATGPDQASGQFSDPCSLECGLLLGATSFVFATGTATAAGRMSGGFTTARQGMVIWGSGFVFAMGAGIAVSGDGDRQERAISLAGLGALGGSLVGLVSEALLGDSTSEQRLAATLVGAAVGILAGGVYGALSSDVPSVPNGPASTLVGPVFSIPVGF